jgi:hypothetical protein
MIVQLKNVHWGPRFIVPSITIRLYTGCVLLREELDDELLDKELESLGVRGKPVSYTNAWYIRRLGNQTWIKVGESSNRVRDFAVRLDTTDVSDGPYQVMGFMSVTVRTDQGDVVVSRQNIADFDIKNGAGRKKQKTRHLMN